MRGRAVENSIAFTWSVAVANPNQGSVLADPNLLRPKSPGSGWLILRWRQVLGAVNPPEGLPEQLLACHPREGFPQDVSHARHEALVCWPPHELTGEG